LEAFISTLNRWGKERIPFLFLIDFEMKKPLAFQLSTIDPRVLLYDCNGVTNAGDHNKPENHTNIEMMIQPVGLDKFKEKFYKVFDHLEYGDSYLTNLTIKTPLNLNYTLHDLFFLSRAKYKLLYRNEFLVFSPEIFVQIRDGKIYSYPMKGTIDGSVPDARNKILSDQKELAEHVTIVDLIRNDLSRISENVKVTRFRYIDTLKTSGKQLLQVSSEIVGDLPPDYREYIGSMIFELLPAGSVSGAPKPRTLEIIKQAEGEDRGYYTGVFGIFDGNNFDSGVMIRFIEMNGQDFYYRSGGGITTQSVAEKEYQEVIDKIYVPVD
jgi:para-aminobenzoate synthetase component 1